MKRNPIIRMDIFNSADVGNFLYLYYNNVADSQVVLNPTESHFGPKQLSPPNPITDSDLATSVDNKMVPSYLKLCPIMKRMGRMVYDSRRRIFIGSGPI
jgi:hypothetical protein